jgi:hypothetical protein
VSGKAGAG